MGDKVSLIIPVYNTAKDILFRCLNSCICQTYKNLEIIVVNDGSTDNTEEYIDEFINAFPDKISKYNIDNSGASLARKYGLEKANGKFIFFIDADDFIEEFAILSLIECQKENDSDVVVGQYFLLSEEKRIEINQYEIIKGELSNVKSFLLHKLPITLWPNLYRKSILMEIVFYNYIVGEDMVINSQIFSIPDIKVSILNKAIYSYYRHDSSLTKTNNENKTREGYEAYLKNIEILSSRVNINLVQEQLCFNMLSMLYSLIILNSRYTNEMIFKIKNFDRKTINLSLSRFPFFKRNLLYSFVFIRISQDVIKKVVAIARKYN